METTSFETHPSRYRHWKLTVDGELATLVMAVDGDHPHKPGYELKLNSYDLAVDIELADAIQRLRFEHPAVKALVITADLDRVFCSGANIYMLGQSSHSFKVNFCKFTNETRLYLEDAAANSGLGTVSACKGTTAGGGYELALACDEIMLVDDGNSAVSFPETPLLAVLPGTGGLTRLVDKRKVRRDRADVFCTVAEGIKGKRAKEWGLIDHLVPRTSWDKAVSERARSLAAKQTITRGPAVELAPLTPKNDGDRLTYRYVELAIDRGERTASLLVRGPERAEDVDAVAATNSEPWALRAFRELDDALLHLRFDLPDIGVVVLRTAGVANAVKASDESLAKSASGLAREIRLFQRRVLKRLDNTARSIFAVADRTDSCFEGVLLELALAADRFYALIDSSGGAGARSASSEARSTIDSSGGAGARSASSEARSTIDSSGGAGARSASSEARSTIDSSGGIAVRTSVANSGFMTMSSGLSRLEARFFGEPARVQRVLGRGLEGPIGSEEAEQLGIVTIAADDIDFADELRIAIEERASLSPDALTGMEASLRFVGPETLETKIFGRLSAWQNWIFTRANSTGEHGALTLYGRPERPQFQWKRT